MEKITQQDFSIKYEKIEPIFLHPSKEDALWYFSRKKKRKHRQFLQLFKATTLKNLSSFEMMFQVLFKL